MEKTLRTVISEQETSPFLFRRLNVSDAKALSDLINSQDASDLKYFSPHGFELSSIEKQFSNGSFLMLGVFDNERIIGYFFLRLFANKKCFVGRLIEKSYRGKGIGNDMNRIIYETAWRMGFRCLSTISRNNAAVMRAHAKNPTMVVRKELQDDYLLVEFIKKIDSG